MVFPVLIWIALFFMIVAGILYVIYLAYSSMLEKIVREYEENMNENSRKKRKATKAR